MEEKKFDIDLDQSSIDLYSDKDLVQDFICSICLNVLTNPVIDSCQHMFCKQCIDKVQARKNVCPLSNLPITQLSPIPKALQNFLSNLKIKCKYHEKGCKWVGKNSNFENHLQQECEFEFHTCKICQKNIGNKSEFQKHLKDDAIEHYYKTEKLLEQKNKNQLSNEIIVQKLLCENQIITTLHEHPLKLYNTEQRSERWYCDSVTDSPEKICLMGHQKQYVERGYPKYICAQSCNKYYCPLCVLKYLKK